ncbi:MAG: zinc ribbon domain-containing protein [Candidatus Heimdallarchaeota archaeon]|nr:zinc ribbon domain-containing protein [Candidatus Heimdallarchaeota archaeon]
MTYNKNCPFCGSIIEPGSKFCQNCGASIDDLKSANDYGSSSSVRIIGTSNITPSEQQYPIQPQTYTYQQPYQQQPAYYQPTTTIYVPQQREDSLANLSIIMAILSCTGILPIIGSIIAIITGHIAHARSKSSVALVALILGYIGVIGMILIFIFIFTPWYW